jgi:uncharacterized protein YqgV (UPF0045/DUF77 family)
MGTVIKAKDLGELLRAVKGCHEALYNVDVKRIYN